MLQCVDRLLLDWYLVRMARTTVIRVRERTARVWNNLAARIGCSVPELVSRMEAGDTESIIAWQTAAAVEAQIDEQNE